MKELAEKWLRRANMCRKNADQTQDRMTEQAYLAEAYALEVCADELKRKIKETS